MPITLGEVTFQRPTCVNFMLTVMNSELRSIVLTEVVIVLVAIIFQPLEQECARSKVDTRAQIIAHMASRASEILNFQLGVTARVPSLHRHPWLRSVRPDIEML